MTTRKSNRNASKRTTRPESRPRVPEPTQVQIEAPGERCAPLAAAYASGRSLNRLEWHLEQAWLLPAINAGEARKHAAAVHEILTTLAWELQPATALPAWKRLETILLEWRDEWDNLFGSAEHISVVEDTCALLRRELAEDGDYSPTRLLRDAWADALRRARRYYLGVLDPIIEYLGEHCQRTLLLGQWLDQALHPRAVYRYMCVWRRTPSTVPPRGVSPFLVPSRNISPASATTEEVDAPAPVLYLLSSDIPVPEAGWVEQLKLYWHGAGLPEPFPAELLPPEGEAVAAEQLGELDQMICGELADIMPQDRIPPEDRTRPMSKKEAVLLMGYPEAKSGVESLRTAILDGSIPCEKQTRERYVFSKWNFPKEVWDQLS